MNTILLFLAIAFVGHSVLGAETEKNDRQGRQFLLPPPGVFYPGYFNYPYFPYHQAYQQLYKNRPLYESEGNSDARSPFRSFYNSEIGQDETEDYLEDEERELLSRQNLFGLSNLNSAVNPFQQLWNFLPKPVISNPNNNGIWKNLRGTCTDGSGKSGICAPAAGCARNGGKASGACGVALVCCVNTISKCGGQMTLNNTYWESPTSVSSESTCSLTVTLDSNLLEQKKPVCQVRLDFESFTINQPAATTICNVDTFTVGGAVNRVPTICGDNGGQHMYLEASSSRSSMQLMFSFGVSNIARSWKIKVGLIPCGADFLAPKDCLQFFTASAGTVRSFNWRDIAVPAGQTRQLANQDYKICFRNENINDKKSVTNCLTQCTTQQNGNAFLLTGVAGATSQAGAGCTTDFILFQNAFNPAGNGGVANSDRFCGGALNIANNNGPVTLCSNTKDFSLSYVTNDNEPGGATPDTANTGFCFTFEQRL